MDGSAVTVAVLIAWAVAHDAARIDITVATLVDLMVGRRLGGVAMLLTSSWAMPLPGLAGLNMLLSTQATMVKNVVMPLWLYCPLTFFGRTSLVMLSRTCSQVVACVLKHASAMLGVVVAMRASLVDCCVGGNASRLG